MGVPQAELKRAPGRDAGHAARRPAERGHEVDAVVGLVGDLRAIRRPAGPAEVVGGVAGERDRAPAGHLADVELHRVGGARRVGDVLAVGRQGGIDLEPLVARDLGGAADRGERSGRRCRDRGAAGSRARPARRSAAAARSAREVRSRRPAPLRPATTGRSAPANCATGLNRSAGVLARARCSAAATSAGTAGRSWVMGGGVAVRCWWMMLSTVGPVNGAWPASISYSTQPSAYRSLRPSRSRSPAACSGLM